ncbi:unnamed protein product [Orchesella dallaii]|uniref:Uncharacterized protein n=1 Tax=Orchesella dallaii TaxID=48710 RepID=A0ABP1PXC2_9HEXA
MPEIKAAALRTVHDIVSGTPMKEAIKDSIKSIPGNVGRRLLAPILQAVGSINSRKRKKSTAKPLVLKSCKIKKRKIVKPKLSKRKSAKSARKKPTSKKDIFM